MRGGGGGGWDFRKVEFFVSNMVGINIWEKIVPKQF